jgi:hypothetical protein
LAGKTGFLRRMGTGSEQGMSRECKFPDTRFVARWRVRSDRSR